MGRSTANLQALHQGGVSCNPVYGLQYTLEVTTGDAHDDEEEKPLLPLPRRQLAAGRRGAAVLAVWAALAVVYLYTYARSLAGGAHSRDLKWMAPHTGMIGGYLAAAVLSWTVAQWATVPLAARWRRLAWGLRGGLAASLMFFLAYDHGNDFQYHGLYNWLLFVVIAMPINLVIGGIYLWYTSMTPRRFYLSFFGSGAAFAALVGVMLLFYQHQWYRGLFGRTMDVSHGECNYPRNLPFVDLLPSGAQNFWTAPSQHCKATQHFEATFSDEGLLTIIGCRHPEVMSYTEFPTTRRWPTEWKVYHKASYQTHVLNRMKAEPYTAPVKLTSEAVLARCGEEERMLVRVQPLRQRLPPEPPLAEASSSGSSEGGLVESGVGGKAAKGGSRSTSSVPSAEAAAGAKRAAAEAAAGADSSKGAAGNPQGGPKLNVMVLFIDSVSRRHFFRRMPATARAMERIQKLGRADVYQFFRYHTVGFSTDPNTHAMYTGTSFPNPGATPVWQAFRKAGYISGSVYNLCEGWGADYNELATHHDHELVAPFCDPEYHPVTPDGEPYQIFKGAFSILRRCMRGRHVHQYNFDYMRSWLRAYHGVTPSFLVSSFHEGHEGTGEVLKTMDGDTADFLLNDLNPARLNDTLVFVLADHGLTMGLNFLFTTNGKVEHKNPFLAVLAPKWLPAAYPHLAAALRGNEQRLLTAYDIYATLHHVLHLGSADGAAAAAAAAGGDTLPEQYGRWAAYGNVSAAVHWGASLLAPLPAGRSCQEAGVPPDDPWHQCMCHLPKEEED